MLDSCSWTPGLALWALPVSARLLYFYDAELDDGQRKREPDEGR